MMEQENQKTKKLFVRIVGVAAGIAVIFLGVTGIRPATFLGGVAQKNVAAQASLRIEPSTSQQGKGQAFSVNVVLHTGNESPKDVDVVLAYDTSRINAMYVDTTAASFEGISQHYTLSSGKVEITGTLPENVVDKDQDVVIGKIYFRALQSLGDVNLHFEKEKTTITSYSSSENILGDTSDGQVTITIL